LAKEPVPFTGIIYSPQKRARHRIRFLPVIGPGGGGDRWGPFPRHHPTLKNGG